MKQVNLYDLILPPMLSVTELNEYVGKRVRYYISEDAVFDKEDAVDEAVIVVSAVAKGEWTEARLFNGKHGLFTILYNNAINETHLYSMEEGT